MELVVRVEGGTPEGSEGEQRVEPPLAARTTGWIIVPVRAAPRGKSVFSLALSQ